MARKPPDVDLEARRREIGDTALERELGYYLNEMYIHSNAVLHREKVVFMLIPKAAATSIQHAANLRRNTAEWRSKAYVLNEVPDYHKIAFVRHPLDRIISCWRSMVWEKLHRTFHLFGLEPQTPFPEFVRVVAEVDDERADKHFRAQSWSLTTDAGRLIPDFLGNVENMAKDWEMVQGIMRCVNRKVRPLGRANVSRGPVPKWDPETLEIAKQRYADDIRHFYEEETRP